MVGVGTLIGVASIGFAGLILQKILEVAGLQQHSQFIGILSVSGVVVLIINTIVKVLGALRALG